MKKTFAVFGLGQFGLSLVEELARHDADVMAIDIDEERVKKAATFIPTVFIADATDEKALKELDIKSVDHAIIAYGNNIQASILTTVILVEMGIKHLTVRVDNEYYAPILKKLGADEVVAPQRMAGTGLANRLQNESFTDYYSLGNNFSVVQISINKNFRPQTIAFLNPRNVFNVNIILINRKTKTFAPKATDNIEPGDIVFIVGKTKDIEKFNKEINN